MRLRIHQISVSYGQLSAVSQASLDIDNGEFVTLLGPNGAGKSSLLRGVAGLVPICGGEVTLIYDTGSRQFAGVPAWERVTAGLRYVPQEKPIFRDLTVFDNLALVLRSFHEIPKKGSRAMISEVLTSFSELKDRYRQLAGTLSGGEQRMLSLACALLHRELIKITTGNDAILLLDEPSHGLAPAAIDRIDLHLRNLRSRGMSILCAEQSATFTARLADRTYLMRRAHVSESCLPADVFTSEFYAEYFGVMSLPSSKRC